jgi:hypothetical protein
MTHALRRIVLALGLAGLLVAIPIVALAADATYAVAGREVLAINGAGVCPTSPDLSIFAGQAFVDADDPAGYWAASVLHARLKTSAGEMTEICGGPFALTLTSGQTIAGVFAGNQGAITAHQPMCGTAACSSNTLGTLCVQTFAVKDGLVGVGGSPNGSFDATLSHFGFWTGSACQTPSLLFLLFHPEFIPTVSGEVSFF